MPARDLENKLTSETDIADAAPETEEASTLQAAEGEVPAVAPEAEATPATASASEQAFEEQPAISDQTFLDSGMHLPDDYKAACEACGAPDRWKDEYRDGHTTAKGWSQPADGGRADGFTLKKGTSASQALRDFMQGPTIANYRIIGVAVEMEELRDELGDQKFDRMFGSKDGEVDSGIPKSQRLQITSGMYTIPFRDQMRAIAEAADEPQKAPIEEKKPEIAAAPLVEEKKKATVAKEPDPVVIADEMGVEKEDRQYV